MTGPFLKKLFADLDRLKAEGLIAEEALERIKQDAEVRQAKRDAAAKRKEERYLAAREKWFSRMKY